MRFTQGHSRQRESHATPIAGEQSAQSHFARRGPRLIPGSVDFNEADVVFWKVSCSNAYRVAWARMLASLGPRDGGPRPACWSRAPRCRGLACGYFGFRSGQNRHCVWCDPLADAIRPADALREPQLSLHAMMMGYAFVCPTLKRWRGLQVRSGSAMSPV